MTPTPTSQPASVNLQYQGKESSRIFFSLILEKLYIYSITSGNISLTSQDGESQLVLSVQLIINFIQTFTYESAGSVLFLLQTGSLYCAHHTGRRTAFPHINAALSGAAEKNTSS